MAPGDRKKANLRVVPQQSSVEYQLDALAATAAAPAPDVKPELRRDLNVSPGRGETVTVKAPESVTAFPLYKLEWGIAQLMNGKRTLAQIAAEAARVGLAATPDLVRAFARELAGYRFLIASERVGAALRSSGTAEVQPMSDEERQLLGTAMAMQGKGDIDAAVSYLLAVLEINPANHTVRALLREYEHEPRVAMDEEVVTGDPDRVRRLVVRIAVGVLSAAMLAGGGLALWRHPEWRSLAGWRGHRPAATAVPEADAPAAVARARVPMQAAGRRPVAIPMDGNFRRGAGEGAAVAAGDTVAVV